MQSSRPLYSASTIAVATAIGSFLAGAILLSMNCIRLGRLRSAIPAVILGGAATALKFLVVFVLYDYDRVVTLIVSTLLFVVEAIVTYPIVRKSEKKAIAMGTNVATISQSGTALISVACLCFAANGLVTIGAYGAAIGWELRGSRIELNERQEVYFNEEATEADARQLIAILSEAGVLDDTAETTVILSKSSNGVTVSFVVHDGVWNVEKSIANFRSVGLLLVDGGLARPLTIRLLSQDYQVKRILDID